ncbi:MAG: 3-phosphoserine/phosphohydroxythreonine transaminase [Candidatus Zixiibacteriota bacterium]
MSKRVYNFNPGPAILPQEVLKTVQAEMLDYRGTGISIVESSHRSKQYDEINDSAIALVREVMGLGDNYHILFLGGGASTQFAMIPMNFSGEGKPGAYVDTGTWSSRAIKESQVIGQTHLAGSSKDQKYDRIPDICSMDIPTNAAYLHVTSNNTIFGTQYHRFPGAGDIPLICDMSSDICSRRLEFTDFAMIYAGAQKNMGAAGVTMVAIRDDLLSRCADGLPTIFDYRTHAGKKSLYNTPPVFGVYVVRLVLQWIKDQGGLASVEKNNVAKKERIYQLIDLHPDFFRGTVQPDSRSWMNITLRLPSEELEQSCIAEAAQVGFIGLKGHRSVGGIRVSLYNAMPLEGAERLADFLESFRKRS